MDPGNTKEYDAIVLKYRENSINFAKRYVNDPHACEDIAQEAFAAAFVYRDRYNPDMPYKTWLFSIVYNKCIDYIRKNRELQSPVIETESREDYMFEAVDSKILLEQALGRLKSDYSVIIQLIELEEMSIRGASKVLGITEVYTKVLLHVRPAGPERRRKNNIDANSGNACSPHFRNYFSK